MRRAGALLAALAVLPGCEGKAPAQVGPRHVPGPGFGSGAGLFVYECDVGGNTDLCSVPVGGGVERRLTSHPAADMYPRWRRDGSGVVFSSERSGRWQLWELSLDGGTPRRLRRSQAREWQADPAPDGKRMALLSSAGGEETLRVVLDASQAGQVLLAHGPRVVLGNPHWDAAGRRLVLSSNAGLGGHRVYLVKAAGGPPRRLSPLTSGACEPRFGPHGDRVAYVRRQHVTRARSQIIEHDLETGRERVLVDWPAHNYDPVYAPDGSELAFVSNIAGAHAVYRQRLDDGQAWRVTFGHPARHPDYQPRP